MQAFLDFLRFERRYSPHTLVSYQTDLGQFAAYLKSAYELDDAAQAMLRGARLPPFTADMTQGQTTVTVPIRYRLEQ